MSYTDLLTLKQPKNQPSPAESKPPTLPPPVSENKSLSMEEKPLTVASQAASQPAIMLASYRDSTIALLRKAVKLVGKDAFFGRFTAEEKGVLADVAYSYKRRGLKTSENEIARIAVNFVVTDYQENGESSLLERVLKALHE